MSTAKKLGREVAFAGIGQQRHNEFAGILGPSRQPHGRTHGRARRDAGKNTVAGHKFPPHAHRIFIGNRHNLVDPLPVVGLGHETGSYALQLVRPRATARKHRR